MSQEEMEHSLATETPVPRRPFECPVEDWLTFLGHRWNSLILWHLQDGSKRHGELAACLPGITPKVLSERLEGLEERGLLNKTVLSRFPRAVRYELTSKGRELIGILDQLELWSRLHRSRS